MTFRRKLKRCLLMAFVTTLMLKIHYDYKAINSVNERGLSDFFFNLSDTSRVNIVNLKNVRDIVLDEQDYNFNQRKTSILNWEQGLVEKQGTPTKSKEEADNEFRGRSSEEDDKRQIDSPMQDQASNNDSRAFYNPSFKKKMEESLQESLNAVKSNLTASKEVIGLAEPVPQDQNKTLSLTPPPDQIPPEPEHPNLKTKAREMVERLEELRKRLKKPGPKGKKPDPKAKRPPPKKFKLSHVVDSVEISFNETEIAQLRAQIHYLNEEQRIYNQETYGRVTNNDTVILIQVHNRLANLKYLVRSLAEVKYINNSLVIFSHDFWDKEINRFVQSIKEFRVMQIFFPFSIQLNPLSFPGRDPRDCAWNHKELLNAHSPGEPLNCLNSKWPDTYGHYREAAFTQIKHHWWWKLVRVFEGLRALQSFSGQVLFLEEDHYVVPDLLHTLRLLTKERDRSMRTHLVLGLGNYVRQTSAAAASVERGDWVVNKYNIGFAFDRRAYNIIKKCQKAFCDYDDYNWDWTLASLGKTCASSQLFMLSLKLSRVLHIGSCGTHVRKGDCNLEKEVSMARARIQGYASTLFPPSLNIGKKFKSSVKSKKSNGGWGDLRDRELCLGIINGTVTTLLERLQYKSWSPV